MPFNPECPACGTKERLPLDLPFSGLPTTAGTSIKGPLTKFQCARCSLVVEETLRTGQREEHYREGYGAYYCRPGAGHADALRYRTIVQSILEQTGSISTVLDIGCGNGGLLRAIGNMCPDASLFGVEPSDNFPRDAATANVTVFNGFFPGAIETQKIPRFDLITSINVLQHVGDLSSYLRGVKNLLKPEGIVFTLVPNGRYPNFELIWADHKWSFAPSNLSMLFANEELTCFREIEFRSNGLQEKIGYFAKRQGASPAMLEPGRTLYTARKQYLKKCSDMVALIEAAAASCKGSLFSFGASTWAFALAAMCPTYQRKLAAYVVDDGEGSFLGKPVINSRDLALGHEDVVVLSVHPISQSDVAARFSDSRARIVRWDNIVAH